MPEPVHSREQELSRALERSSEQTSRVMQELSASSVARLQNDVASRDSQISRLHAQIETLQQGSDGLKRCSEADRVKIQALESYLETERRQNTLMVQRCEQLQQEVERARWRKEQSEEQMGRFHRDCAEIIAKASQSRAQSELRDRLAELIYASKGVCRTPSRVASPVNSPIRQKKVARPCKSAGTKNFDIKRQMRVDETADSQPLCDSAELNLRSRRFGSNTADQFGDGCVRRVLGTMQKKTAEELLHDLEKLEEVQTAPVSHCDTI